jgi:hypothetical protein
MLFYCGRKTENQKKILKKKLFETHLLSNIEMPGPVIPHICAELRSVETISGSHT